MLVVEGYIAGGDYPKICLMQTIDPTQQGASLADMIVRWGVVKISDGEKIVTLTGGPDKNYFPPYTYTTYEIMGEPGRTYTLTAEYDGREVTAVTRIPSPVEIDSIKCIPEGDRRRLELYLTPEKGKTQYFRSMARVRYQHSTLLPSFMSSGESTDSDIETGVLKIPVNRPRTARDTVEFKSSFLPGEEVEVALCTMDREAWSFWREYDNIIAFGGNQFLISASSLSSNVKGGYGYFFGYGMSRRFITVQ